MITDFETNKLYLSLLLKTEKYMPFWIELEKILIKYSIKTLFIEGTRDIWCRDYMPVQIDTINYSQFQYFPDYCIDYRNIKWLTIQEEMQYEKPFVIDVKYIDLIVDGGNIVKFKNKAIMTEKVFKENKKRDKKSVINMLKKALKVDELYFIPVQSFDYTGHADGMVRFYNENILLVNDYSRESDSWRKKLDVALKQTGLEIMPFPYVLYDDKVDGDYTAKGCYINFAQIGNLIIFPQFKVNEDDAALKRIKELYPSPDYYVEPIDASLIAKGGGVLNCLTWNIQKPIIEDAIDYLVPVYGDENKMLVIHKDDTEKQLRDTVCVQLYPIRKEIGGAWSKAKTLKHVEYFNTISSDKISYSKDILNKQFTIEQLSDILELLLTPSLEVLDELVEIPPRLKNSKPKY